MGRGPGLSEGLPLFRTRMVTLLRLCWGRLTMTMVVSQLTVVAVLGLCVGMQGLDRSTISWAVILVAWGLVTFASLLIPTPGGLGVAEVVLVGVLGYGLPVSDQPAVLAAVLLYRIATFLVPIPIGLTTYLYWRRSTAWRRPVNSRGPSAERPASPTTPRPATRVTFDLGDGDLAPVKSGLLDRVRRHSSGITDRNEAAGLTRSSAWSSLPRSWWCCAPRCAVFRRLMDAVEPGLVDRAKAVLVDSVPKLSQPWSMPSRQPTSSRRRKTWRRARRGRSMHSSQ